MLNHVFPTKEVRMVAGKHVLILTNVFQIISGDSVIIRGLSGAPPPEKQIAFSGITAPKLARRPGGPAESS